MGVKSKIKVTYQKVSDSLTNILVNGEQVGEIRRERTAHGVRKKLVYKGYYVGFHTNQKDTTEWIKQAEA